MKDVGLWQYLVRAVENGLVGAALVDRNGTVISIDGELEEDEAMPLAALVMYRLEAPDLADRLFAGEILALAIDDRVVAVAVAKRQLFVVAVLAAETPDQLAIVRELRDFVADRLADSDGPEPPLPVGGTGNPGSGPAELELVEFGITVSRHRAKA